MKSATNPTDTIPVVLQASFHQGSMNFSPHSRGKQCTPIAYTALVYSSLIPLRSWGRNNMDSILQLGDNMYSSVKHQHEYFDYTELPSLVEVGVLSSIVSSSVTHLFSGFLNQSFSTEHSYSLLDAMSIALKVNQAGLLTASGFTVAIMYQNNKYFLYDSHSRDSKGMPCPNGTAVLLTFLTLEQLILHVKKLYAQNIHAQFDVACYRFEKIQPSLTNFASKPVLPPVEKVPLCTSDMQACQSNILKPNTSSTNCNRGATSKRDQGFWTHQKYLNDLNTKKNKKRNRPLTKTEC